MADSTRRESIDRIKISPKSPDLVQYGFNELKTFVQQGLWQIEYLPSWQLIKQRNR